MYVVFRLNWGSLTNVCQIPTIYVEEVNWIFSFKNSLQSNRISKIGKLFFGGIFSFLKHCRAHVLLCNFTMLSSVVYNTSKQYLPH